MKIIVIIVRMLPVGRSKFFACINSSNPDMLSVMKLLLFFSFKKCKAVTETGLAKEQSGRKLYGSASRDLASDS